MGAVGRKMLKTSVGLYLSDLYPEVGHKYDLTKHDFLKAITAVSDDKNGIRLSSPPSFEKNFVADPQLLSTAGDRFMGTASLIDYTQEAIQRAAKLGTPGKGTAAPPTAPPVKSPTVKPSTNYAATP